MGKKKILECVNMVKVGEEWVEQKGMEKKEFDELMSRILECGMESIGFQRMGEKREDKKEG